jgi:ATP-dependent Lon protease
MYYTYSYGGCSITEAVSIPNKRGNFIVTGNCSKSKIETAQLSLLFAKRFLNKLGVVTDFFDQNEVHLHHPDGASKKDGYLGGVYTVTALLSLALNKRVKENIAMAGELGLNGEVLPVTGVRAMVSGALRNGIKTVILPKSNLRDWEEVPESIRNELTAHFVQNYSEVFELTLSDREESLDSRTLE